MPSCVGREAGGQGLAAGTAAYERAATHARWRSSQAAAHLQHHFILVLLLQGLLPQPMVLLYICEGAGAAAAATAAVEQRRQGCSNVSRTALVSSNRQLRERDDSKREEGRGNRWELKSDGARRALFPPHQAVFVERHPPPAAAASGSTAPPPCPKPGYEEDTKEGCTVRRALDQAGRGISLLKQQSTSLQRVLAAFHGRSTARTALLCPDLAPAVLEDLIPYI